MHKCFRLAYRNLLSDKEIEYHKLVLNHLKNLKDNDLLRTSEIAYHTIKSDDKDYLAWYFETYITKDVFDNCIPSIVNLIYRDSGDYITKFIESLEKSEIFE